MKRKVIFTTALIIVLFIFGSSGLVRAYRNLVSNREIVRVSNTLEPSQLPRPLTILQTWDIVSSYAEQLADKPQIASLGSVDSSQDIQQDQSTIGQDGRRRVWLAILVTTQYEEWVTIEDGVITEVIERPSTSLMQFGRRPSFDSPEALNIAQKLRPGFSPGIGEGWGYNFALEIAQGSSVPVVKVHGSFNKKAAFIALDSVNKSLVLAQRQVLTGGGLLFSNDTGKTWKSTNLRDIYVGAITTDPDKQTYAYAVASKDGHLSLFTTEDNGENWREMGALPEIMGDWPYSLKVINDNGTKKFLVGVYSGLWVSADGMAWQPISELPGDAAGWIANIQSIDKYRVLVSITQGKQRGLYSTTDLVHWGKVSDVVYRFSESFDYKQVIATDDLGYSAPILFDLENNSFLELPKGTIRAAGDYNNNFAIYSIQNGLGKYKKGLSPNQPDNNVWTLNKAVASLASSPADSNLILAGIFRGGIFQSIDGGQTWHAVLENPNLLVEGSNEVVAIKFLSSQNVIALNGGYLSWQNF